MAPNPPRETRSAWPLLALALVSGLITMALSVPSSDATREAGDMSRLPLCIPQADTYWYSHIHPAEDCHRYTNT